MRKTLVALCAAFLTLGLASVDVEAKRLGGGSSFGMQRATPRPAAPFPAQNAVPVQRPQPAMTPQAQVPQPAGMSRWLGPIAGIAAGIGLAALFSHFGLGEGFASLMAIALIVFAAIFVVRLLFRRPQPAAVQYAGAPAPYPPIEPVVADAAPAVPAGFDVEGFLRNAKVNFIRLQAANDAGNLDDIRSYTTPEMFAEIKMQYDERGHAPQNTDVVQLDAQLLDLATEERRHIASVRFHGLIREAAGAAPEGFDEVWHLAKPVDGSSGWIVAGIQQVQ
jgi:predicted lipid-binding transport protein (Tim44 family)